MTPKPHDFRKPPPLPAALEANLGQWFRETCRKGSASWSRECEFGLELKFNGVEVIPAGNAFRQLPDTVLQVGVTLGSGDRSVLVVPRPLLLLLLGGMLHESEEALQADREFTPIEASLIPFVVDRFFLGPLEESCHFRAPPELRRDETPTRPLSAFPSDSLVVAAGFEVQSSWQLFTWSWVLPRKGWLSSVEGAPAGKGVEAPPDVEPIVQELPLEVLVQLGAVDCSLLQLATLAPGDLFMLEQPVGEPLSATADGKVLFRVWPGAVGSRQAVAIHSLVEP